MLSFTRAVEPEEVDFAIFLQFLVDCVFKPSSIVVLVTKDDDFMRLIPVRVLDEGDEVRGGDRSMVVEILRENAEMLVDVFMSVANKKVPDIYIVEQLRLDKPLAEREQHLVFVDASVVCLKVESAREKSLLVLDFEDDLPMEKNKETKKSKTDSVMLSIHA